MSKIKIARRVLDIEIGRKEMRGYNKQENRSYVMQNERIIGETSLNNSNIIVDASGRQTINDISKRIKEQKRTYPNIKVVCIDHIALVESSGKGRYEEITKTALKLKPLAKEHDVFLIALSQIKGQRNDEDESTKECYINNLKGSGDIEESADGIVLMWNHTDNSRRHCKIAKARDSGVNIYFDLINQNMYLKQAQGVVSMEKDIKQELKYKGKYD